MKIPESAISIPSNTQKSKFVELVSLPYFRQSITQLISGKAKFQPQATENKDIPSGGRLSDGSEVYDQKFRNQSIVEVEVSAIVYATSHPVYSLGKFTDIDDEYTSQLIEFVKYLQTKNTRVYFYLPPYHPTTYQILSSSDSYGIIIEVESTFRAIAENLGITVIGSYNPEKSLCMADDFYDGMHPKESAVLKSFVSAGLIVP
jgi:hypothetical protein